MSHALPSKKRRIQGREQKRKLKPIKAATEKKRTSVCNATQSSLPTASIPEFPYELETPLNQDWFMKTKGPNRQPLIYLRFQVTGMQTRKIGPFATKEQALAAIDPLVGKVREIVEGEYCEEIEDLLTQVPFQWEDVVSRENVFP
ncbi:MAG: hypothetical protein AB7T38_12695 [Nitrospirales bacterium]